MKLNTKILFIAISMFTLTSCGGWSTSQENAFVESCEKAGGYDCKCALDAAKKAFPNNSDFIEKGGQDANLQKDMLNCSN